MQFAVRHFMKGRARLYAPDLCRNRPLAERTLNWIKQQSGVRGARINYDCGSVVIEFDPKHEQLFRLLFGRLKLMSISELAGMVDIVMKSGDAPPEKSALPGKSLSPHKRFPLALPTASLLLAFAPFPFVRALNAPLMVWNAYPIAVRAYDVWKKEGRLNVDFLDTLAVSASLAQGHFVTGALIWLIKLGDWIRDLTAAGSKRAIGDLLEFRNKTAWVSRDGVVISIVSEDLQVGDEVVVFPGEMIPVDGEIIEGNALIDQKTITGEGLPVSRGVASLPSRRRLFVRGAFRSERKAWVATRRRGRLSV